MREYQADKMPSISPPPAPDDSQFTSLADARGGFAQEMSNNPDLKRRLMAITDAEVGDDNDAAKQAFIESVMNRAARNQSLDAALHSIHNPVTGTGYFDPRTGAHANDPVSDAVQKQWNPMIDRVLGGSNISGFATGNQSGKVTSGGAPITFNPGGTDQFVIEKKTADTNWAAQMRRQVAGSTPVGSEPAPILPMGGGSNGLSIGSTCKR